MNPEGTVYNAMGRINRLSVLCIDAYGVAVKNGFEGTVEEWLESLKGKDGYTPVKGVDYFDGEKGEPFTYEDFTEEQLTALKGADGYTPVKGVDYFDGKDGESGTGITDVRIEEVASETVEEIHFTIDEVAYTAQKGMTWSEWIESDYNTSSIVFDTSSGDVMNSNGESLGYNNPSESGGGTFAMYTGVNEEIIDGKTYEFVEPF